MDNEWAGVCPSGARVDEVLAALNEIYPGGRQVVGRFVKVSQDPLVELGQTAKGSPVLHLAAGIDRAALRRDLATMLSPEPVTREFAMVTLARQPGSFSCDGLSIEMQQEMNLLDPSLSSFDELGALRVTVQSPGARSISVGGVRDSRAVRLASGLISLVSWPRSWVPRGGQTYVAVLDQSGRFGNVLGTPGFLLSEPTAGVDEKSLDLQLISDERMAAGPVDLLDGCMYLPQSFELLWNYLRSLPTSEALPVERALAWFEDGITWDRPSASIASMLAAVEAIAPPLPSERCSSCEQQPLRITASVNAFFDEYASRELRAEFRKEVYGLRSALVHGSAHMRVDDGWFSVDPRWETASVKVEASVRAALINWLLVRAREWEQLETDAGDD